MWYRSWGQVSSDSELLGKSRSLLKSSTAGSLEDKLWLYADIQADLSYLHYSLRGLFVKIDQKSIL